MCAHWSNIGSPEESDALFQALGDSFLSATCIDEGLSFFHRDVELIPACNFMLQVNYYAFNVPLNRDRFDVLFPQAFTAAFQQHQHINRIKVASASAEEFLARLQRTVLKNRRGPGVEASHSMKNAFLDGLSNRLSGEPYKVGLRRCIDYTSCSGERDRVSGLCMKLLCERECTNGMSSKGSPKTYRASVKIHIERLVLSAGLDRVIQLIIENSADGGYSVQAWHLDGTLAASFSVSISATMQDLKVGLSKAGMPCACLVLGDRILEGPDSVTLAAIVKGSFTNDHAIRQPGTSEPKVIAVPNSDTAETAAALTVDLPFRLRRPRPIGSDALPEGWTVHVGLGLQNSENFIPSAEATATLADNYTTEHLAVPEKTNMHSGGRPSAVNDIVIGGKAVDPSGEAHNFRQHIRLRPWKDLRSCHIEFDETLTGDGVAPRVREDDCKLSFFVDDVPEEEVFGLFTTRVLFCIDHQTCRGWGLSWETSD